MKLDTVWNFLNHKHIYSGDSDRNVCVGGGGPEFAQNKGRESGHAFDLSPWVSGPAHDTHVGGKLPANEKNVALVFSLSSGLLEQP